MLNIFSQPTCVKCKILKNKLKEKKVNFLDVSDEALVMEASNKSGFLSLPIIFDDRAKEYLTFEQTISNFAL